VDSAVRLQVQKPMVELSEQELEQTLFQLPTGLAPQLGWDRRYHTYRSKRSPSGFPDWCLARDRIIFVELKAEKGKPTPEQVSWLTALTAAGGEVYLWRPTDLEEAAAVLQLRHDPLHPPMAQRKKIPCSRWHFSGGRMDQFMPDLDPIDARRDR
jgi:hypothetical protein